MNNSKKQKVMYLRNIIFGVEDSLVSTVGLLSGIAANQVDQKTIILAGVVLIFVESISMRAVSVLPEYQVSLYESHRDLPFGKVRLAAFLMFISYLIAGLIPLWPYLFFTGQTALITSIVITLMGLFLLGVISAIKFGVRIWRNGIRTLLIGGVAIFVGIVVGKLMGYWGILV